MKFSQVAYSFIWGEAKIFFHTRLKYLIALCGYSKRVARVTSIKDTLSPLVIQNTYVQIDATQNAVRCEEGEACLDFDCPLNQTTWETYKKRLGAKGKKPSNFGERIDFNRNLDGELQDLSRFIKDAHTGGLYLSGGKK